MEQITLINSEALYKASDVARILNISLALTYRLMKDGYIPSIRFGYSVRVRPIDLEEFIRRCRHGEIPSA